jgi:hypothetical protein
MRTFWLIIAALAVAVLSGTATFLAGRTASVDVSQRCPGCRVASCSLLLNARQIGDICKADCGFSEEAFELNRKLAEGRFQLADLMESDGASDDAIMAQVETVIADHEALVDRVVTHVLRIRPYLTLEQQSKLMGMCVDSLNGRWCIRARYGQQGSAESGRRGGGPPPWAGGASANRPGGGGGIGRTLADVRRGDSEFASDIDSLGAELSSERAKLAALLSDQASTDDQIRRQVKAFGDVHDAMERSIASHVLKVRKTLTVEQQKSLILMCTRGIRGME